MFYNDYSLPNNEQFTNISRSYVNVKMQELSDLKDILNKLYIQKDSLRKNSPNHISLLPKLEESISLLEKITMAKNTNIDSQKYNETVVTPYKQNLKNTKKTNVFNNKIFANLFRKLNQSKIPNTKFHTIVISTDEIITQSKEHCHSHKQICTRQIDIIRLLLLYMSLRPTCPYIHALSQIATDQLDIYISLTSD